MRICIGWQALAFLLVMAGTGALVWTVLTLLGGGEDVDTLPTLRAWADLWNEAHGFGPGQ